MNAKVLVPVGICVPTLLNMRPSSLANDVCHVAAVGPLSKSLYSREAPVVASMTELMAAVRCVGRFCKVRMLVATEYLVADGGGTVAGSSRLARCYLLG